MDNQHVKDPRDSDAEVYNNHTNIYGARAGGKNTKKSQKEKEMDMSQVLPEECLAHIISYTSPPDACRCALVSRNFQSAADTDVVWKGFLPSDLDEIISSSPASSSSQLTALSKKELYFHLCNKPILVNNGTMVRMILLYLCYRTGVGIMCESSFLKKYDSAPAIIWGINVILQGRKRIYKDYKKLNQD